MADVIRCKRCERDEAAARGVVDTAHFRWVAVPGLKAHLVNCRLLADLSRYEISAACGRRHSASVWRQWLALGQGEGGSVMSDAGHVADVGNMLARGGTP